jgi:hypothetical protein
VRVRYAFFGAVLLGAALAACGGGGGGGTPPVRTPTPSPTPTPTSTAATASTTVTLSAGAQNVTLPTDYTPVPYTSGTMKLPGGSGSGTLTVSQSVAPSSAAVLDAVHMRSSVKASASTRIRVAASSSGAPYTTALYVTLTAPASGTITMNGTPGFSLTFAGAPSSAFYLAEYESGYWITVGEFATSGDTISIAASSSGTQTISDGSALNYAIYTGGTLPTPNILGCVGAQGESATRKSGASAQAVGVQPIATGASYAYTGTLTETISRSSPCPMPTSTSNAVVTVDATVTSPPSGSASGTVDEHSTESDASSLETTTTTTDAIVESSTYNGDASFSELSETTTDEVGDSIVTTYATPLVYAIESPLPYSGTIANGSPSTVNTTLADGSTQKRTYTGNGTYNETDTIAGISSQDNIVVNSDFSGSYVIQAPNFGITSLEFAYSAPSSGVITLTPYVAGSPQPTLQYPQWWTSGSPLYSDTTTGQASATVPAPCSPPAGYTTADGFERTISTIDPVLGYTDTRTIDSYVTPGSPPVGPVCVVISDTENIYYDYFLDTPFSLFVTPNGQPLQTDTISEAYWFSSDPTTSAVVRKDATGARSIPGLEASIAAHEAGIDFRRSLQRSQRIDSFVRGLATRHFGGVK